MSAGNTPAPIEARYHADVSVYIIWSRLDGRYWGIVPLDVPGRIPVGLRHVGLPDRRFAAGRRCRREQLASLRAHAGPGARWRYRRRRLRPLPALARRRRVDARTGHARLSLQRRLEPRVAGRPRTREPRRP